MLKKVKARDFSFDISGSSTPSRKNRSDLEVETVRIKKNKKAEKPTQARKTDEPDDSDFDSLDNRPRPPKPKRNKRHLVAKPKKPPSAKNALMVLEPVNPNRISRLNHKGMNSILGKDAEQLQQLLEAGESDNALSQLNKRLIQTSIDLISEVETGIRESKGRYGVHSFNGLVQSIRELMIDLQSTQDRGAIGLTIVENIIRPALLEVGMIIMKELALIQDDAKSLGLPEANMKEFRERMVESRTRVGNQLMTKHDEIRDQIIQSLQR